MCAPAPAGTMPRITSMQAAARYTSEPDLDMHLTRFIERLADGSWRYATYVWNDDGSDAMRFRPSRTAAPATRVPQCRCWASARFSSRPTATRLPRTPNR